MTNNTRNIILVLVLIIIGGAIWYLEAEKAPTLVGPAPEVVSKPILSEPATTTAATTSEATSTQTSVKNVVNRSAILAAKASEYSKAKEFVDPTGFINTPPFTLSSLVGNKVVLLDFWTYSCINCQRTLPYLKAWYQKYKDYGLVIVGVHTPEFDFEKVYSNVASAVKADGVIYPVVLDSNMGTWNAYNNEYWPEEYLIDIDGYVVHNNIGEGNYAETEQAIQAALKERAEVLGLPDNIPAGIVSPSDIVSMDANGVQSPETYFGAERNQYLGDGTQATIGTQTLTIPVNITLNTLYLGGTWNFQSQYAESAPTGTTDDTITYQYDAKNVYMVASSVNGTKIQILLDGKPLGNQAGADVSSDSTALIQANKLYSLVNGTSYGEHTLQITVPSGGLDAYTFTFG